MSVWHQKYNPNGSPAVTTVTLTGTSQNIALPTPDTQVMLTYTGTGGAYRFGDSSAVAVATDEPLPAGTSMSLIEMVPAFSSVLQGPSLYIAVIGNGTLTISSGHV